MASKYQRMTKAELIKALQAMEKELRTASRQNAAVPYDRLLQDLQVHQEELEAQNQALRNAQQMLEESRSRYAELYDLAPLGYVSLDAEGRIREINLTGAAMLRIERSRLIGSSFVRQVASGDRTLFGDHLRHCQAKTDLAVTELHLNRKDGSTLYVELHSVPIEDTAAKTRGCLTAMTNIAERKRMERAAHENEALFRAIFEGAGMGMALADTEGRLIKTNPALQEMLGYTAPELAAMTFAELTHPDDVPTDRQLYAELVAGKRDDYQIEKRYRRKDGQIVWGRLTVSLVLDRQAHPRYGIRLVENISERKWAEAEINRLNRDLEWRASELGLANKELDSFSYSVSHDLRAPLATIRNLVRVALQDYGPQLPAEGQHLLNLVHDNVVSMNRLIEDLLGFSRMSRQPLKKQTVQTADLVRRVVAKLMTTACDRRVEIVIGDLPACQADPALLTQVWVNLLSNSFKFTSHCENARIEIGSWSEEHETVYFVKDNGAGFDMELADRLFGVFQRLHAEEDYPGTGVGLAIVERIVRRHGGRTWAEGQVGRGASFYFTLGGIEYDRLKDSA